MPMFNPCQPCCSGCVLTPDLIAKLPPTIVGQHLTSGFFDGVLTKTVVPLGQDLWELYVGSFTPTPTSDLCFTDHRQGLVKYQIIRNAKTCCLVLVLSCASADFLATYGANSISYPACFFQYTDPTLGHVYGFSRTQFTGLLAYIEYGYFSGPPPDLAAPLTTAFGPAPQRLTCDLTLGLGPAAPPEFSASFPLVYSYTRTGGCEACGALAAGVVWAQLYSGTVPHVFGLMPPGSTALGGYDLSNWIVACSVQQIDTFPAGLIATVGLSPPGICFDNVYHTGLMYTTLGADSRFVFPFSASTPPGVSNWMQGYIIPGGGAPVPGATAVFFRIDVHV